MCVNVYSMCTFNIYSTYVYSYIYSACVLCEKIDHIEANFSVNLNQTVLKFKYIFWLFFTEIHLNF